MVTNNIQIAGFKHMVNNPGEIINKINKISADCTIQLLDARGIGGYEHVLHATIHAIKAFQRNENIAKDLGIEICIRVSAQRQISKALQILGIKEGEMEICVVAVNCNNDIIEKLNYIFDKRDDKILKPDIKILKKIYNITDIELSFGIENILIERTSLLILEA